MTTITESQLQATNGNTYPLQSLAWSGEPILDACAVQADYGHLLLLATSGALYGIDLDSGRSQQLCKVELPDISNADNDEHFGAASYRLLASSDGKYSAIVVDRGRTGIVVETMSGAVTMRLNGGDYHDYTVPFSACFLSFDGRNVLIHRTDWNRLDAADPATGKSLTDRHIAPYTSGGKMPAHYLDYFHGRLLPSPDGSHIFDDGWVWHPISIPRVWSVTDWLGSNQWESEDGASIVDLAARDDWTTPACWINEQYIALYNLAVWDKEEYAETGHGMGVRIFDVTESEQSSDGRWPMDIDAKKVFDLFSDGSRLYVAADTGTTVWDVATRAQIAGFPGFIAKLYNAARSALIAVEPNAIKSLRIR